MSEDASVNFVANDNVSDIVKKIARNIETLSNNFEDLSGALKDLTSSQAGFVQGASAISKSTANISKDTQTAAKSSNGLRDALTKTGVEASKALNAFDNTTQSVGKLEKGAVKVTRNFSDFFAELSGEEIGQLSQKLEEAGSSLSQFLSGGKIDLNLAPAVAQLNELQEKLQKPISPVTDFSSAEDAFGEMRRLNNSFRDEVDQTTYQLRELAKAGSIGGSFEGFKELEQTLKSLQSGGDSSGIEKILNFKEVSAQSEALISRVKEIKTSLIEIGPAAKSGGEKAVSTFVQLSTELRKANTESESLTKKLKESQDQFSRKISGANSQLGAMGFEEIKLGDIFPSSEQQKVVQLQQKIDNAVRSSIDEGAVKKTLNLFLAQDRQLKSVDKNVVALTSHLPRLRYALYDVSNSATIFGGAIVAAVGATVKVAADYERAFADVIRTTSDGTEETSLKVNQLRDDLVNLSQDIPVSFADLAQIATLAGQLGVAVDVVDEFTESVAKFSATTDVTIDSAATSFGRLDQLVDGVNGQFEKLGSAILKVGVNAVATESDIIAISTQIASVANIAGFSAAELVGFSSALASVGTRPELARGTFTRLFTEIQQAVAGGGDQLDSFSRIANQSSDEFAANWGAGSGPEQIIAILEGLNAAGVGADGVLREIGITSVRDTPTLLKLAQGVEEVKDQINLSKIGFAEGAELQNQYSIITATLTERIAVLKNNLSAVAAAFGTLSGPISVAVELLSGFLKALEFVIGTKVGGFVVGVAAIFVSFAGIAALVVGRLARLGAGAASVGTAMTELFTTTALAKIQFKQLKGVTESATITKLKATVETKRLNVAQAQANIGMRTGVVSTARYNTSLVRLRANLVSTGAGLSLMATRLRLTGAAAAAAARQTKLYGTAVKTLKATIGVGIFLAVAAGVEFLVKKMADLDDETKELSERFEDWGSILEAVKQDSRDFANATAENIDEFTVVGKAAGDAGEEITDYSRALAVASGEEEALTSLLDDSSDAFDRQAIAIGKNTKAILAQRLAKELAAAAEGPTLLQKVQADFNLLDPSRNSNILEKESAALDALVSTFGTELSAQLREAGFSYKDWSDAIVSGNVELADSFANNLTPAATKLADELEDDNATKYAEEIETLRTIAENGTSGLLNFASSNDEVTAAVRQAKIEIEATGGIYSDAEEDLRDFQKALSEVVNAAYAQVNAERAMSNSITRLGAVFQEQGAEIAATSQEMQKAIIDIINAADNEEDAVSGLAGFYSAIVDGGYASADQLEILQGVIISTYRTAAATQIATLQDMRNALSITKAAASAMGSDRGKFNLAIANNVEVQDIDAQIRGLRDSIENIDSIADVTGDAAEAAGLLARGYGDAASAAQGTAGAARDVADEAERAAEEVRTLSDFASDLESVFSRAFDIRFGAEQGVDSLAEEWYKFTEQVNDAVGALEELQATQQDLGADRAIKEYFLSVAEAYDDELRAATLRNELSELNKEQAENERALAEAESITAGATSVSGDSVQGRANRQALLGLVGNYQSYIGVLAESGAGQDELREATEKARREFVEQARELGFQEADIQKYAVAFDDVRTAIDSVPRNITVEANVNPALQALNELNASLNRQIDKANELSRALGQPVPSPGAVDPNADQKAAIRAEIASLEAARNRALGSDRRLYTGRIDALKAQLRSFSGGGFTGRGGMMQPAGVVHKGEYVVPQKYVNQSTGLPDANFLSQLQNGMRSFAMGGFAGGQSGGNDGGTMMVELSPFDRKLLADAGNVQLRLNGKVVAEATNRSNVVDAQRGAN